MCDNLTHTLKHRINSHPIHDKESRQAGEPGRNETDKTN